METQLKKSKPAHSLLYKGQNADYCDKCFQTLDVKLKELVWDSPLFLF